MLSVRTDQGRKICIAPVYTGPDSFRARAESSVKTENGASLTLGIPGTGLVWGCLNLYSGCNGLWIVPAVKHRWDIRQFSLCQHTSGGGCSWWSRANYANSSPAGEALYGICILREVPLQQHRVALAGGWYGEVTSLASTASP